MAKSAGLNVHLINVETMSTVSLSSLVSDVTRIVYRGWMLSDHEYTQLEEQFGRKLLTSKQRYFDAHYLPNWYNDIASMTIQSIITTEDQAVEGIQHFPQGAFIKDYVKSLKTGKGSRVDNEADVRQAIATMKFYRGTIEGGIVLRKLVTLKPDSEVRFFVAHNTVFSPCHNQVQYARAQKVATKLAYKNLPFYSVDIATLENGTNIVIEVGDGQVSDYVGWDLKNFMRVLQHLAD